MLNFKKSLALVLAAATAFTFAPVANLGQAVTAEAADANIQLVKESTKSIDLVKDDQASLTLKPLAELDKTLATGSKATVSIDGGGDIACIDTSAITSTPASGSRKSSLTNLDPDAAGGTKIYLRAVDNGSTTLHIQYLDSNSLPVAHQDIPVTVGNLIPNLSVAGSKLTATKTSDGDPIADDNVTFASGTDATSTKAGLTAGDAGKGKTRNQIEVTFNNQSGVSETGKISLDVKSSDEKVAKASLAASDNGEFASKSAAAGQKAYINVEYKGVGSTTITITEYAENASGKKILQTSTTVSVVVSDATDTLTVSYDGNRDGVADKTEAKAKINDQAYGYDITVPASGAWTVNSTDGWDRSHENYYEVITPTSDAGDYIAATDTTTIDPTTGVAHTSGSAVKNKVRKTLTTVNGPTLYLDTNANKTSKISASDSLKRQISYKVTGTTAISVDNDGNVTVQDNAISKDLTNDSNIIVSVQRQGNGNSTVAGLQVVIPVVVYTKDATDLTVKKANGQTIAKTVSGDNLSGVSDDTDLPVIYLSTKDKKTYTIDAQSNAGANFISGVTQKSFNDSTASDVVSYDNATRTFTALKYGTAVAKITARNSANTYGTATVYFRVQVVNKSAANTITVDPSVINLTASNKTATINAKASVAGTTLKYELVTAAGSDTTTTSSNITVDAATGKVTYVSSDSGSAVVRVSGNETNEAIEPDPVYVAVNYSSAKAPSTLDVTTKEITLKAGESQKIAATGSAITYKSSNTDVADVAADGTVTAKKAGVAFVTVTSPADDQHAEGTAIVTVYVNQDGEADAVKPAKVTGVKVKNKKGGFVTVTWTKQNQKNIKYYVKKTVGKKSSGKSVNGGKTTLQVKKGATVKVKVKAYVYNQAGDKLVGSYSKTVTFKTDKK